MTKNPFGPLVRLPMPPALALGLLLALSALPGATAPAAAQGYGAAVATGEGEVLVGESLNERSPGYVYVYRKGEEGWTQVQRLAASDAIDGDHFGRALAVVGGDLLVGATVVDNTTGAVYVFRKDESGIWQEVSKLHASDGAPGDAYGRTIATDGHRVLVAAMGHAESQGAVYVLARNEAGEWAEEGKLTVDPAEPNGAFGVAVTVDGDHALVGAPAADGRNGVAYAFRREGGAWAQAAKLDMRFAEIDEIAAQIGNEDLGQPGFPPGFGSAVGLANGLAFVGAPRGGEFLDGAVFAFEMDDSSSDWRPVAVHRPFDGRPGTSFGSAIFSAGAELWIGAPGAPDGGRFYVLSWDAGTEGPGALAKFAVDDLEDGDGMGSVVALGEGIGVVGLERDDYGLGTAAIIEDVGGRWATATRVAGEVLALDAITGDDVACQDGQAGEFTCTDVDIVSFLPVQELGGARGVEVNDLWGWTDPVTGTEWALVGRYDGTSFIDLSDPSNPVYAGNLPLTEGANPNVWRDVKVYKDHAFIVSDGAGEHGMQVFDLTQLREPRDGPETFEETVHYDRIHSAHNIVINEETGFAYAVGSSGGGDTCGGGLHMIDIREPTSPTFAGCFAHGNTGRRGTGYSHDAQCVVYEGPDEEHRGKELCFGSNETALSISDVTDKDAPVALAMENYPNVGYSHQGWLDEAQEYFYMNDELDELQGKASSTRTLVWDVKDLDEPILVKEHFSDVASSDHNLYIRGDLMYQSNYVSGLRVLDISDRENPREVAFFDTVPWSEDAPGFDGSWSNYPFFASGIIVVTSGKEGVFVLRNARRNLIP